MIHPDPRFPGCPLLRAPGARGGSRPVAGIARVSARAGWLVLLLAPAVLPAQRPAADAGVAAAGGTAAERRVASPAAETQEVRRAFNLLVAAANRLDADAEDGLFWRSPDLISVAQGTPTMGWEARDTNTRRWYGSLERQSIRPDRVETRSVAPGVVSLMSTFRQEIRAKDGRRWSGTGVWSLVFRRVEDDWKVVYEHYSYED